MYIFRSGRGAAGVRRGHIPYRNSMLTMVLRDSLGEGEEGEGGKEGGREGGRRVGGREGGRKRGRKGGRKLTLPTLPQVGTA